MSPRSIDDFEPDPIDDAIGRSLRDLAPRADDTDEVLGALEPRAIRARRRHRVGRAASAAAVVTLVAGLGALAAANDPDRGVPFAATTTVPGATTSTTSTTAPTTAPTTGVPVGGTTPGSGTTPDATPAPTTGTTTPTTLPAEERTFTSDGGSVWVRLEGGTLTLIAATPNADYTAEIVDERADRVEVRFTSDDGDRESRIRVRIEDGRIVDDIENSG
ncbi:MAG TPA: hypothetical protein VFZ83_08265 [Acidimicrobiia bacterium]|nr:hypothetical protein [Acidimicrobiia bacterium]